MSIETECGRTGDGGLCAIASIRKTALLLFAGILLIGGSAGHARSQVALHLGHLDQVDFYVHISRLTDAPLPGISELEQRIREESLGLIARQGIETGRRIEPALSLRVEIWDVEKSEGGGYAVLVSATLQEMVVVSRVPSLGETSAITWSNQEILVAGPETLAAEIEAAALALIEEFLDECRAAKS